MGWRGNMINAGFMLLGASRLHRLAAPLTRGIGPILTFHNVRPELPDAFAPNQLLAVTPDFLDKVIRRLHRDGYTIVTMDDAVRRLKAGGSGDRWAVLTFDDGFRDNLEHAMPVLERHGTPAIFYVTTGFLDRTARLWWVELEEAIRRADRVTVTVAGEHLDLDARTPAAKTAAFAAVYWRLRAGPEQQLLDVIETLCRQHGVDSRALIERLCLGWPEIEAMARHPLVTIGAHTVSHPMLAKHPDAVVRAELAQGKAALERRLGCPVRHIAYPVGDRTSAGSREFRLAAEAGYISAVTTRPGLLFPGHRDRLLALPRISMNGHHQTLREFDVLLSGVALALWNGGRRLARL